VPFALNIAMSILEFLSRKFRHYCAMAGRASSILTSVYFGLSFLLLAALGVSSWNLIVPIALVFSLSMIIFACMLLSESRKYEREARPPVTSIPLDQLASSLRGSNEHEQRGSGCTNVRAADKVRAEREAGVAGKIRFAGRNALLTPPMFLPD
jgi:hypothetical protein